MKPVRATLPVVLAIVTACSMIAPLSAAAQPAAAKDQPADGRQASAWQRELTERNDRMARIAGVGGGRAASTRQGTARRTPAPRRQGGQRRDGSPWSFRPRSPHVRPLRATDDWFERRLYARYGYGGDVRRGYGIGDRYRYGYPYGYRYGGRW